MPTGLYGAIFVKFGRTDKWIQGYSNKGWKESKFRIVFPTGSRFDDAGDGGYKLPYNGSGL